MITQSTEFSKLGKNPVRHLRSMHNSRLLMQLAIQLPSVMLRLKIFVARFLQVKLKLLQKLGHTKKEWVTFSTLFL